MVNEPKFNPFRPNSMVTPGMFVGRIDEIRTNEQCLFQAKNGNPQHFLVQGERGIGKSSLLYYVQLIASGKITSLSGKRFNFLTVGIDLGGCETQVEIIRKIGRGLRTAIGQREALKELAKNFWEWLTNWEILGVKYSKPDSSVDPELVADELVSMLCEFCVATADELDGVLLLIDEADRPSAEAGLGEFLKYLSERLMRNGCNDVLFGLAGLPLVMQRLRESHESSPRLFQSMKLVPLQVEERVGVVDLGLAEAESVNGYRTAITSDAMELLAELSEGYPHFVQQFSYCAFDHDDDREIDEEDVGEGAYKDGGALSQLGDKYFNEMYHARIASEDYRRVLDAMAGHGDGWVSRKTIIKESGVQESIVGNALSALKTKNIIIQDEKLRGMYRLPTNSFAAWINAVRMAKAKTDAANDGAL